MMRRDVAGVKSLVDSATNTLPTTRPTGVASSVVIGVAGYLAGSLGYLRLYRRRGARFVLANKEDDQPDHARLVARAGLAFQAAAARIAADQPGWRRFRVGVNSGEVVAGEGTRSRLAPDADVEPLPPLQVTGKAEPVTAYIVRGLPV